MNCGEMRRDILRMGLAAKSWGAHMGGSLSMVEIMAALYGSILKMDPGNMRDEFRDRVIISKGHGIPAQYAALRQKGILSEKQLSLFKCNDSPLSAHPSLNPDLGIEFSGGSLGQGLSLGVGAAMALKFKQNHSSRIFVVLGDGECDEGSVWEAAMAAAHYKLDNLVAIIDQNALQYDGSTKDVLDLGDLRAKWSAFGWETRMVDGHSVDEIVRAISSPAIKPLAVLAKTIKGRGISFMENVPAWHNGVVTKTVFDKAMAELENESD